MARGNVLRPVEGHSEPDPHIVDDPARSQPEGRRTPLRSARDAAGATIAVTLGLVPHVLHHIGLLAGAAVITGAGGNALFFGIGLLFTVPMLRRLYRRFATWKAPAIAVIVFAALFSISAFVVGPAISGGTGESGNDSPSQPVPASTSGHTDHH